MKKLALAILFTFTFLMTARAELVAVWNFDGETGLEKTAGTDSTGLWTGLTDGTRSVVDTTGTYVTRVFDEGRQSYVWKFTPETYNKGGFIKLGMIPELGTDPSSTTQASDFTISLWVKSDPSIFSASTYGNNIIWGDRNAGGGYTNTYNFFKVTPNGLEYVNSNDVNDIKRTTHNLSSSTDAWQYLTLTKSGTTIQAYLNGNAVGTPANVTGITLESVELKLGGESVTAETWPGSLDQVAVHNSALSASQVKDAYRISLSEPMAAKRAAQLAASNGKITSLSNFDTTSQSMTKGSTWTQGDGAVTWNVKEFGLENRGGSWHSNIEGEIVGVSDYGTTNSVLKISGTFGESTSAHWTGTALQSSTTYEATPENPLIFSIDRLCLDFSNTNARSSIWLLKDTDHYIHFSQNTENQNRWTFNVDTTGGGSSFNYSDDLGFHNMALKYDGTNIWMHADGKLVGKTSSSTLGKDVYLIINGQSWGTSGTNQGYVNVLFDSAQLIRPVAAQTEVPVVCDFSDGTTNGWNVTGSGTASTKMNTTNTGKLSLEGTADAQWPTQYALNGLQVAVVRESLDFSSPNTEGGLKISSMGGQEYVTVSQRDDGQWALAWEGLTVTGLEKDGTPITITGNSADLYLGDYFQTQMVMSAQATDDGIEFTLKLDSNEYTFSTDWNPDGVFASLYSTGTDAYVGFDNFAIAGNEIPEPATWALGLLLFAGLGLIRRKK
ncbi:MAG: LamG domain-containing protein [Thermoguttaceae bacterium]|nr:LamG domain-containing protein [Thermoguttaceae bacterium]